MKKSETVIRLEAECNARQSECDRLREALGEKFRQLVRRYGLQWTTQPKPGDWRMLAEIGKVLTADDKREAV